MLKDPGPQQYQLEMVTLESLVPKEHLVRKIDRAVDFEFIRDETRHLYCEDNGRPPVDPVRLFKIMLLGYLFGIPSERKLVKEIEVNVAYRWFLKMSLTEKVIDASTLSQNRRRRFNGTDIFERIFGQIIEQAMAKGLIGGTTLYTDSTHLKANANPHKHENQERDIRPSAYLEELDAAVEEDRKNEGLRPLASSKHTNKPAKTKNTKVSKTDPESGYMHRDHKPKGFFYLDHRTVDSQHSFILDSYVTPGNVNDAQPYLGRLDHTRRRFHLNTCVVGLDAGYFQAPICHGLEQRQIQGVMGYRRPHKGPNTYRKRDFNYDSKTDCYQCPAGQTLSYRTTSREGYRQYQTAAGICSQCPQKSLCTRGPHKVLTRHVWEASKERANRRRLMPWAKKVYKRRNETVERSFADAKQHHGHRYARYRGLSKVQMQCWLAATAQNIKKLALLVAFWWFYRYMQRSGTAGASI